VGERRREDLISAGNVMEIGEASEETETVGGVNEIEGFVCTLVVVVVVVLVNNSKFSHALSMEREREREGHGCCCQLLEPTLFLSLCLSD
jgi:hypothetical protein